MELDFIKNILSQSFIIWSFVIFISIIIVNIFPFMFIVYPHIIVFLGVFLFKEFWVEWYFLYLLLILWSIIWEIISYYLWYIYWKKILNNNIFHKFGLKKITKKIHNNKYKTIFFWKLTPGLFGFIPISYWMLKVEFIYFFVFNTIITIFSISYVFLISYFSIEIFDKYFWKYLLYFILFLIIIYLIISILRNKKKIIKS